MKTFQNAKPGSKAATCDYLLSVGALESVAIRQLADVHHMTDEQAKSKFLGHIAYLRKNQLASIEVKKIGGERRFKASVLPHLQGQKSVPNVSVTSHSGATIATSTIGKPATVKKLMSGKSDIVKRIDVLLSGGIRFSDLVSTLIAEFGLSKPKAAGKAHGRIRELGAVETRGFYRVSLS